MDFSSRQLRAFHLVARHRSFARAAEALLITPSGLSVLIRELERQVGFRLFDRTTRHVSLTAFGNELLAVTEPSLSMLDAAMFRIEQTAKAEKDGSPSERLRGSPQMFFRRPSGSFVSAVQTCAFDCSMAGLTRLNNAFKPESSIWE